MQDHYQQLLGTTLDSYTEQRFSEYLCEGNRELLAELPILTTDPEYFANAHTFLYYALNYEDNLQLLWNYLQLIYDRGSTEHFCHLVHASSQSWWWSGERLTALLNDNTAFSLQQKTELQLYLLFEATTPERMKETKTVLLQNVAAHPQLIEEIVTQSQGRIRWMALSLVYSSDPIRFEPIFAEIIAKIRDDDANWLNPLVIAAASNGFSSAVLNTKLTAIWEHFPYRSGYWVLQRSFHHPDALKDGAADKSAKANDDFAQRLDYLYSTAKKISLSDDLLLLGGYYNALETSQFTALSSFAARFPSNMLLDLARKVSSDPKTSPNFLLHLWRLFAKLEISPQPLSDIFQQQYNQQVEAIFALLDEKAVKNESSHEDEELKKQKLFYGMTRRWLLLGDADALVQLPCSEKHDLAQPSLQSGLRSLAALTGLHIQNEELKERNERLIQLLIVLRDSYNLSALLQNALLHYGWRARQGLDYLFALLPNSEERLDLLEFLLFPLKETRHQFQEESFAALTEAAHAYLLEREVDTLAYLSSRSSDCGLLDAYYQDNPDADPTPLLALLEIRNKALRNHVLKLITNYPQAKAGLEELRRHSRKDVREYADKALAALAGINANLLPTNRDEQTVADASFDMENFVHQNYGKAEAKRLAFTQPERWPRVRWADRDQEATSDSIRCYASLYLESKEIARLYSGEKMRPFFNEDDMHRLAVYLFNCWRDAGAEAKYKGAMTLYAIHGGESAVHALKGLINDFAEAGRSAMVKDVLRAIAASQTNLALATLDNLAKKAKNKAVRKHATAIIAEIAALLGLSLEELADRIVPTLGLNERGELSLSTAGGDKTGRSFTAILQDDLSIQLINSEGKTLRSLPAFSEKVDDRAAYDRSKAELSLLRKELKPLLRAQSKRLELSLFESFTWSSQQFMERFIANPIMQRFASSLVFGIYQGNELLASFRYAGDGSFSDSNDEEFELPAEAMIRLAHPAELSDDKLQAWQEQFDDYEIKQPFSQLHRTVCRPENGHQTVIDSFRDKKFGNFTLGRLIKESWYGSHASSYDGFLCIYCDDKPSGLTACLDFEGRAYLWEQNAESCVITHLFFLETAAVDRSDESRPMPEKLALPLQQVPVRFYSEILLTIQQITE